MQKILTFQGQLYYTRGLAKNQVDKLKVKLRDEEKEDYYILLAAMDTSIKKVLEMDDFYLPTGRFLEKIYIDQKARIMKLMSGLIRLR